MFEWLNVCQCQWSRSCGLRGRVLRVANGIFETPSFFPSDPSESPHVAQFSSGRNVTKVDRNLVIV